MLPSVLIYFRWNDSLSYFSSIIITNITLLITFCKMTTHHKACTLLAVHSSRSMPASLIFRLNSQCNRRLTCSPKESGFKQSQTACCLCVAQIVTFSQDFFHHGDIFFINLPSKVKLRNNQTERNVYMWMQQ